MHRPRDGPRDLSHCPQRSPSPYRNGRTGKSGRHGRRYSDDAGKRRKEDTSRLRRSLSGSSSSYTRRKRDDDDDRMIRSPKRQRRHSSSTSPDPRSRDSWGDYKSSRRRMSRSRSPYTKSRDGDRWAIRRRNRYASPYRSADNHRRSSRHRNRSGSPQRRRCRASQSPNRFKKSRHNSRSPNRRHQSSRRHHHKSPTPGPRRSKDPLPLQQAAFSAETAVVKPEAPAPTEKQKPNYAPSGLLAAETNTVMTGSTSFVLKYHEPPEARLPHSSAAWRLYIFKAKDLLETLELHTRSCWLFGRERAVVDVPVEHPSASKQHAVVQFRYVEKKNEWGDRKGEVKPYVIDLDSANGTQVNGEKVEGRRYVELRTGDVLGFGESTREYVLLLPPKG